MHNFLRISLISILTLGSVQAFAGPSELGKYYRTLRSNYEMMQEIYRRCPSLDKPDLIQRSKVENIMIEKVGIEQYAHFMGVISKSSLKKDAIATVDKLFSTLNEECSSSDLSAVVSRITTVHKQNFQLLEKEPSITKAQPVPVPLRRAE
ncbi:hypothetical protein [Gilvimarinus sp. 1_MG-2023]|uniref:hypothetical protein n=1 Tax=Gilvimarinus sp. 1_MG-2023 TaxID=3062638 RepID=UPI0026E34854|nr:hypothetical protein [Gilvimarinus sp. 1_MG-2023]MDO6748010.1 hypothetical protein [Gilvimarinus sp. 1_MG-2023]